MDEVDDDHDVSWYHRNQKTNDNVTHYDDHQVWTQILYVSWLCKCKYVNIVVKLMLLIYFQVSFLDLLWQSMATAESGSFGEQLIASSPPSIFDLLQDDSASSLPLQEYGKKA